MNSKQKELILAPALLSTNRMIRTFKVQWLFYKGKLQNYDSKLMEPIVNPLLETLDCPYLIAREKGRILVCITLNLMIFIKRVK